MHKLILSRVPFNTQLLAAVTQTAEAMGISVINLDQLEHYPETVLSDADMLFGYFPLELLRHADSLKWYQLPCAGVDRYCTHSLYPQNDFTMTNASGAFGTAIGEQLLMGCLMLLRRMPEYQAQQRAHIWKRVGDLGFMGGSTITVLGTGNLGRTFAGFAHAMGATIIGVNQSGHDAGSSFSAIYAIDRLHAAVSQADIVVSCLPLTEKTNGIMDTSFFMAMPKGAHFLNVGRGKTVCQSALINALQSGHLGGAMLDVAEIEPMPEDCPLWDMENVIITPHISGSDLDPQNAQITYRIFMDNLHRYMAGQPLKNVVDRNKGY